MNINPKTLRRFGLILATVVLLIIGISKIPLSSDSIRQKLIDTVAENSDYRLDILGTFDTYLSLNPGFEATQVRIREKDLSTVYEIRELAVNVSLMSLIFGDPVISSLSIDGMDIEHQPAVEIVDETLDDASTGKFQLPLIKRIVLRNVLLRHGEADELLIEGLELKQNLVGEGFGLVGEGHFNDQSYRIRGSLGSVDQLISPGVDYPVDIQLEHLSAHISLQGVINQPMAAAGLDLNLSAAISDFSAFLNAYNVEVPNMGELKAIATLAGTLTAPSVEQMDIKLTKGETISLKLTGAIANVLELENDVIDVSGYINRDEEFLSWALPNDLMSIEEWRLQGNLIADKKGLRLADMDIQGVDPAGLNLTFKGDGLLENFDAVQPFSHLDVMASMASENTAAARPFLIDALPEMGPVEGKFRILAASDQALTVEDIDISVGLSDDVLLLYKGRVANIPLGADPVTGYDLKWELSAADSGKLATLFKIELPAIAPVKIQGRFTGSKIKSSLKEITLTAGKSSGVKLATKGNIEFDDFSKDEYLKDINLKVDFSSPDTAKLASFIEQNLPELGPAKGNFTLRGPLNNLRANKINLNFGNPNNLTLKASGEVRKVTLEPELKLSGIHLELDTKAPSTDKLSTLLNFKLPNFGQLQGKGRIVDDKGNLALQAAEISIGPGDKPLIRAQGNIGDILKLKGVAWKIYLDIDTDKSLENLLGYPIPDLGMLHGDMVVSDQDGSLGIEKIEMRSDQELLKLKVSGFFDDINNADEMDVKIEASTQSLEIVGLLLGQNWPESKPANFTGSIKVLKKDVAIDGKLIVGKTEIITDIDGVKLDPRLSVKGNISTDVIYLSDFGFPETEADIPAETGEQEIEPEPQKTAKAPKKDDRMFSKEPLSLEWMQNIDLDLDIEAGDIIGTGAKLDSFLIPVQIINGGVLLISPATFLYDEGVIHLDYKLNSLKKPATASFKMTADDIAIGSSLAHVGAQVPVDGSLNINIDLSTYGQSKADMAANLNGIVEIGMEEMALPRTVVDLLGVDLFGWVLSSTLGRGHKVKLDCGIVRFKAEQGLLTSELLFLDGQSVTVSGEGNIDLRKETIDLSIFPRKKNTLWAKVTPVNVNGPLTSPTGSPVVGTAMGAATASQYAGLALAPQVVIPVKALGFLGGLFRKDDSKGDNSACLKYVEEQN